MRNIENLEIDVNDVNFWKLPVVSFLSQLCQALYCFNHRYHESPDGKEMVKVPDTYKATLTPGVRDPNYYSHEDIGKEPFSPRESKKQFLDRFINVYLVRRDASEDSSKDIVFAREDFKKGQVITMFFNYKKTYKRVFIRNIKNLFEILNYNPEDVYSATRLSEDNANEVCTMIEDARNIPIIDENIKYIIESSEYIYEPLETTDKKVVTQLLQ